MVDDALRSLVEALDSFSIAEAVGFGAGGYLILFVVVAVHELAHAAVALLRTDGLVVAHVGKSPGTAAVDLARRQLPDDVDEGFLVTTELRDATADDRSRFAFRYGAALHDVERVMAEHGQRYW